MNLKLFDGDIKLADEFEQFPLIFSRASIANNPDGSVLQVNQSGHQGYTVGVNGLGVFEGYTNLFSANISTGGDTLQNNTGFVTSNTQYDNTTSKSGAGSICRTAHQDSISLYNDPPINVQAGQTYTFNVFGKTNVINPTEFRGYLSWRDNTLTNIIGTATSLNKVPNGDFQEFSITATAPVGATKVYCFIFVNGTTAGVSKAWWDSAQLINNSYPLPWILGGTTRQPESCYIPITDVKKFLNKDEMSIEFLLNIPAGWQDIGVNQRILNCGSGNNFLRVYKDLTGKYISMITRSDTEANSFATYPQTIPLGNMPISLNYDKTTQRLLVLNTTNTAPKRQFEILGNIDIGHVSNGQQLNTFIKSLVFSKLRNDNELFSRQKFAKENGYFPIDDKVLAFIPLESDLKAYRRITV